MKGDESLKLTVPAYWTTIIIIFIWLDDFYFSSVQLSVKYHSLSLSQCHIQIIKKVANDAPNENSVGDEVPEKNYTALVICDNLFLWAFSAEFLGFE